MDWIHLAQDTTHWWALVNMAMNLWAPYNTGNLCKTTIWAEFWPWSHFSYFYNICIQTKFIHKKCTFPTKNFPSSSSLLILLIQSFITEFAVSLQPVSKSHGITLHRNISTTWGGSCCSSSGKARSWYTWRVRNTLKKNSVIPIHAMKTHMHILKFSSRHSWMISLTPQPLHIHGKRASNTHWIGGSVGPQANLDVLGKRWISCHCSYLNWSFTLYPGHYTDYISMALLIHIHQLDDGNVSTKFSYGEGGSGNENKWQVRAKYRILLTYTADGGE